eukprot:gene13590-biopygen9577
MCTGGGTATSPRDLPQLLACDRQRPLRAPGRVKAGCLSAHSSTHHRAQGRSALGRTRSGENVVQVEPGGTESIGSDPRAHYLDLPRDGRRHPPRTEPDVRGELGGGDAGVHQGGQPCSHNLIGRHPGTRAVEGCGGPNQPAADGYRRTARQSGCGEQGVLPQLRACQWQAHGVIGICLVGWRGRGAGMSSFSMLSPQRPRAQRPRA